jgi:alpha-glucosidase
MVMFERTRSAVRIGRSALATFAAFVLLGTAVLSAQTFQTFRSAQNKPHAAKAPSAPWWKHAVIYEIYPRSFQDSNGDGIGDLNGITQRLDYIQALGVDAIWLSPIYPSPQVDFGYDISDYENVDPQYGTLADFDHLTSEANKRGIRVIMDMVMNHTSDKHPWFIESESSKTNPKHDWYVWRDGKSGGTPPDSPPNNWTSNFGHSAWQYEASRGQYYYHRFYIQQPDLNWRNPDVEKAMFDAVRFWLDRGVAGFRLDAIPTLFEDPKLPDAKQLPGTNAYGDPNQNTSLYENLPEVHGVMRRLRATVDKYPGQRVVIGETYLPNIAELDKWYGGAKHNELQLPMDMQVGFIDKLDASTFRERISDAETKISGNQPLFVFDNHDNIRSWNRYGDGTHDELMARLLAAILFTTRSTALMYYGQELGMTTTTPERKEDVKDPIGITGWPREKGRDGERTPMQWDASQNSGFSTGSSTWLPVASDYTTKNVKAEQNDPNSLFNWYKQLIAMRKTDPTLRDGSMTMLDVTNPSVLSYLRNGVAGHPPVLVVLNFTGTPQTVSFDPRKDRLPAAKVHTLLTSAPSLDQQSDITHIELPPYATWIASLQ